MLLPFLGFSQNSTFSPYSRYGLGELNQRTFAHNAGMGGACIALKPDSTMPIFINAGNPAAYALIKLTSLEVGGTFTDTKFKGINSWANKWGTYFSYATLGFPVRGNGGACFGIMPYSSVGYDTKNIVNEANIGNVSYNFSGNGGLAKAFLGYGVMPFNKSLIRFKRKQVLRPDSLKLSHVKYMRRQFVHKFWSDFSMGANVNYLFGDIENATRAVYPNSILYNNTFRSRSMTMGDFTGNFGLQSAFSIDSVRSHNGHRRALKNKLKITLGYFMALNNTMNVKYNTEVYNYILNSVGQEILRDTVLYRSNQSGKIKLPLEQGFGIGFKKGERLNIVADFAITDWQNFKYLDETNALKNNYRIAAGMNFVPEKYAAGSGAFAKRLNYRFGLSYQTGYIQYNNAVLSNYAVSAGLGLPVGIGRLSSMVNISATYGILNSSNASLMKENYWRINFGFTFCDRWFQKFRYD